MSEPFSEREKNSIRGIRGYKNRHEFHEGIGRLTLGKWRRKLVMAESIMAGAGSEFSLQAALARGRLKPELQTGRPRRNEAFARRDVAWPGPRVDPPVPTGGTPVPRTLEDKLQPVLDHAVAAAELQRIQKVL